MNLWINQQSTWIFESISKADDSSTIESMISISRADAPDESLKFRIGRLQHGRYFFGLARWSGGTQHTQLHIVKLHHGFGQVFHSPVIPYTWKSSCSSWSCSSGAGSCVPILTGPWSSGLSLCSSTRIAGTGCIAACVNTAPGCFNSCRPKLVATEPPVTLCVRNATWMHSWRKKCWCLFVLTSVRLMCDFNVFQSKITVLRPELSKKQLGLTTPLQNQVKAAHAADGSNEYGRCNAKLIWQFRPRAWSKWVGASLCQHKDEKAWFMTRRRHSNYTTKPVRYM